MVTDDPTFPEAGEKPVMAVFPPFVRTTKFVADVAVTLPVVTEIGPNAALAGTTTTSDVSVAEATLAGVAAPLKLTVLFVAVLSKFVPLMVMVDPTYCHPGRKPAMFGAVDPGVAAKIRVAGVATPPVGVVLLPQALSIKNNAETKTTGNADVFFIMNLMLTSIRSIRSSLFFADFFRQYCVS